MFLLPAFSCVSALFLAFSSLAQPAERVMELPKAAADCMGAIKITDEIGPIKSSAAHGLQFEVQNQGGQYPFLHTREYNPAWFRFNADADGELELTISSVNAGDNYDFALYASEGPWFCRSFPFELIGNPARANCSTADMGTGITGINATGSDSLITFDAADAFCNSLRVQKGDAFYLLVDSSTRPQAGYTIKIRVKEDAHE
ncbi:MAG: hypothetical protein V4616_10175 [Bacteroidota bacterium]